jgi:hypothetical protein
VIVPRIPGLIQTVKVEKAAVRAKDTVDDAEIRSRNLEFYATIISVSRVLKSWRASGTAFGHAGPVVSLPPMKLKSIRDIARNAFAPRADDLIR